jgi:hypothetical protein
MKIEVEISNEDIVQMKKLHEFMSLPLGESRLENTIHEFLIDNGIVGSDVSIVVDMQYANHEEE